MTPGIVRSAAFLIFFAACGSASAQARPPVAGDDPIVLPADTAASSSRMHASTDVSLRRSGYEGAPTFQMGGPGYFFKMDLPVRRLGDFTSYGVGIYPVNVGVYVRRLAILPYVSAGGSVNVVLHEQAMNGGSQNLAGVVAQARMAVGVKYFPIRSFAASFELGMAKAAGALVISPGSGNDAAMPRSGVGSTLDGSFGIEWL